MSYSPTGRRIRFACEHQRIPAPGEERKLVKDVEPVFIEADFAQIEFRIAAQLRRDNHE